MYLTTEKISHFPSFTPFRSAAKRSLPHDNLDLISRSFDESVLRRLKTLNSNSSPPSSISLSWLSLAVDFLSSTHAEAQTLVANLSSSAASSPSDDSLALYLDGSVKLLDLCNSISSEIESLRQRRLPINFVLQLLDFSGDGCRMPSLDKIRRAGDSLSNWENSSSRVSAKRRTLQIYRPETLIRDMVAGLGSLPRGKISSAGKLIRRTFYAVGALTVFVTGVAVSALCGVPEEIAAVPVPAEFLWAESFNDLQLAILGKTNRRFSEEGRKARLLEELDDVETRVRGVRAVINGVDQGDKYSSSENVKEGKLGNAVKELEATMERFSDRLDRLSNGVNGVFNTVLCVRNGMLEKYRNSHDEKQLVK